MANIIKFQETSSVTLNRQLTLANKSFTEIVAIGDGNCAFNAFALALIELIITNQLQLNADNQQKLLDELQNPISLYYLEERLKLYRNQTNSFSEDSIAYSDLATPLANFIAFLKQGPDYNKFIEYVHQHAKERLGIAALHIGLARALRSIGAIQYKQNLHDIGVGAEDLLHRDATELLDEGVIAGQESLSALAQQLQLNLTIYKGETVLEDEHIPDAATVHLIHVGTGADQHWNYLLPDDHQNGFARVLAPQANADTKALVNDIESQIHEEEAIARQFKEARLLNHNEDIQAALDNAVNLSMNTSKNLITLKASEGSENSYQHLLEAHAKYSNAILRNVRKSVDLTKRNVESLRMATKLHESLLKGEVEASVAPLPDIYKADESLARTLQNAEILSFLSLHYSALTKAHVEKIKQESELLHPPTPRRTAIR